MFLLNKNKPIVVKDKALPKGIKLRKQEKWCPYCSSPVVFQKDKTLGVSRCPICGISDRDFWVKRVNR